MSKKEKLIEDIVGLVGNNICLYCRSCEVYPDFEDVFEVASFKRDLRELLEKKVIE